MTDNMAQGIVVVIDEDGDTLLILKDPLLSLKPWNDAGTTSNDVPRAELGTTYNDEQHSASGDRTFATNKTVPDMRYLVSSALLKNVSKYFRNTFSDRFSETTLNLDDGRYHVVVEGFNPKAFEHVMNIIHVKSKRLPKKIDVEQLAHIAVLVDYYDMKDAVSFHAETWAKAVAKMKFPTTYCQNLVLRTFVARTFGDDESFQRGAQLITKTSKGPIQDLGIPMFGFAEILEDRRRMVIQALIKDIKGLPLKIDLYGCSGACTLMLLGHFVKQSCAMRFTGHRFDGIEAPFHGISFGSLSSKLIDCSELPSWCGSHCDIYLHGNPHPCTLEKFAEDVLLTAEGSLEARFE